MFAVPAEDMAARFAILQTIADYSYRFDGRDADGWSLLFTDDGVWEFRPSDPATAIAPFCMSGRAAIRDWAEGRFRELGPAARFLHHQSSTSFDVLGPDGAETRTLVAVTRTDAGEVPRLTFAGTYHDIWRKTASGWLFAHRLFIT